MLKAKMGSVAPLNASLRLGSDVQSKWLGEWQVGRSYAPLDKVSRGGSSFVCVRPCTAVDPLVDVGDGVEGQYWILIAKRGEDGKAFTYDMFTEEQLEALRGPEGPAGKDGKDGHDGQDGSPGLAGKDGEQGPAGVSGVYVGSGDMPEGYNVQVDLEGNGVSLEDMIDEAVGRLMEASY